MAADIKQMSKADRTRFVSFMKEVTDAHNELVKQGKKCTKHDWINKYRRGSTLDRKALTVRVKDIFREERLKNPKQRVPIDMTELGEPFGKATAATMVQGEVMRLKNKKDGGAPTNSTEVLKVRYASLPKEQKEIKVKRAIEISRKKTILQKIGDEVTAPDTNDFELFDDGRFFASSRWMHLFYILS